MGATVFQEFNFTLLLLHGNGDASGAGHHGGQRRQFVIGDRGKERRQDAGAERGVSRKRAHDRRGR